MVCIAICGDSASGKSVFASKLAKRLGNTIILECDRYHKWERNDPAWNTMTQLNPDGNDIDQLNKDVQDLKNGKTIFRRSYNHHTGKFTLPEEIIPSQNLIVCGLHTLMCPDNLYDLKIFLNTDEKLKTIWKITRDTQYRGYTLNQVSEQIARRVGDYERFIKPQMANADLIAKPYEY